MEKNLSQEKFETHENQGTKQQAEKDHVASKEAKRETAGVTEEALISSLMQYWNALPLVDKHRFLAKWFTIPEKEMSPDEEWILPSKDGSLEPLHSLEEIRKHFREHFDVGDIPTICFIAGNVFMDFDLTNQIQDFALVCSRQAVEFSKEEGVNCHG